MTKPPDTRLTMSRKQPNIFIANHTHALDPFAIVSSLSVGSFLRLAPFSFMTAPIFYKPLWLRPFSWLAGCFPAKPTSPRTAHKAGVEAAVYYLSHGYTLVMFPEGKRAFNGPLPAKPGIQLILSQVNSVKLYLVHITWKKKTRINTLDMVEHSLTNDSAQRLLDAVYKL